MLSKEESLEVLQGQVRDFPKLLVMLGTGWNAVLDGAEVEAEVPYKELIGVEASVPGHEGKLVIARIEGRRTAFMQGRLHMYEGYSGEEATLPIRVFAQAGLQQLVVTSASGGINENYRVGDFVVLSDLISVFLSFDPPLTGPKFLDMSQVFDPKMRETAISILKKEQLPHKEGVYMYLHGPNFETPADKRVCKILGADVVGMSTVPETMMARWLGVEVLGLSFVTNLAFGEHSHEEVLGAARAGEGMMRMLLTEVITNL